MTTLTDREAQQQTTHRDAQSTTPWEVRFTDVKAWVQALDKHVDRDLIEDNEVYFSVTAGVATQEQVEGRPAPAATARAPTSPRYVEASYVARGKLQKLSVACGVSWSREAPTDVARELYAPTVQECAENVQAAVRAVSVALSHHPHLEVNSGAALHLHAIDDGPWVAYAGTSIEAPPRETCGVCGVEIHFTNERWRDERGRYEVLRRVMFSPRKVLARAWAAEVQLYDCRHRRSKKRRSGWRPRQACPDRPSAMSLIRSACCTLNGAARWANTHCSATRRATGSQRKGTHRCLSICASHCQRSTGGRYDLARRAAA
jgi:hypothetical protein